MPGTCQAPTDVARPGICPDLIYFLSVFGEYSESENLQIRRQARVASCNMDTVAGEDVEELGHSGWLLVLCGLHGDETKQETENKEIVIPFTISSVYNAYVVTVSAFSVRSPCR